MMADERRFIALRSEAGYAHVGAAFRAVGDAVVEMDALLRGFASPVRLAAVLLWALPKLTEPAPETEERVRAIIKRIMDRTHERLTSASTDAVGDAFGNNAALASALVEACSRLMERAATERAIDAMRGDGGHA